jgi:pimeloyl-ACP methyl ester carboxylesterase
MPIAEVNGATLYFEEHGKGLPLVFVHGAGGNHMSWWQQVPEFARRYRCVTFDQRGWGLSLDSDGAGPAALVADLAGLLDHLEIAEGFLVAQSMGSLAAFGLAVRQPSRVKGLVLANTFAGMRRAVWLASSDDVRQSVRDIWERRQAETVKRALSREFSSRHKDRAFLYKQIRLLNEHGPNHHHAGTRVDRYRALERSGELAFTAEQMASVTAPALFIAGEHDEVMPVVLMEVASQMVPGARLVVVPGAGHSVYFEQPETFNQVVGEFLSSCLPEERR